MIVWQSSEFSSFGRYWCLLGSICDALCHLGCSVWCDRCGVCVWWGKMVRPVGGGQARVEWRSPVSLSSNVALI